MDTTYTLARNEQYNSLEITFAGKPSETVRAALKALRFRWHSVKKVWYGRADEQTVRAALDGLRNKGKTLRKEIIIPSEIVTAETASKYYFPDSVY